jgi:hypothetical protein
MGLGLSRQEGLSPGMFLINTCTMSCGPAPHLGLYHVPCACSLVRPAPVLTIAPLTFSLVHLPPPPCFSVTGRRWGVLSWVRDHILQEFKNLYLTRFRTFKIARPPQIKTLEGRGPRTDKHLPQSPLKGKIFQMATFCISFYQSHLSIVCGVI